MTAAETLIAGRYRLVSSLGAGGMGRVWLARDEVLRRDVAIKEIALPFGLADDEREEMRERTLREARAAARLSHPNVVQIYDVQHGDERPWIVMEYVRSRSLLQVIRENGPLPVDQVAGIGLAVLSALDAANRVGVLHRDVKPSNVLIADDGRVVLTDFGSAMIDEGEGALTRTGVILGSPQYIAPERVQTGVSTAEADLWSLGATLYDAVEGRPPYTRETTLATLIALSRDKPDPTKLAGPLKPVLKGLLQRNPRDRMKPVEVEERLRRVADVQTTVRLRHVPGLGAEPPRPADLAEVVRYEVTSAAAAAAVGQGPLAAIDAEPVPPAARSPLSGRAPVPVPRRPQRLLWAVAAGVSAVVLALGAAAFTLERTGSPDDSPLNGALGPATLSSSAPASPQSVSPSVVAAGPVTLPAKFTWWDDKKTGFRVAYPTGWDHQPERQGMFFCAPGGPPTLRVLDWGRPNQDLQAALAREEARAKMAGYHRMRLEPSGQGAVWEYTFTDPKAGPLHGLDQAFVMKGRTYLIQWRTPPAKWQANLNNLEIIAGSFQPRP